MIIDNVEFSATANEIIDELVAQLRANGIQYIQKTIDTPRNLQICCPYHKGGMERRPSAGIKKSDGTFHCMACGEVHSLAEVISHCFMKDDTGFFGWNWLLKNFASFEVENRKPIDFDFDRSVKKEIKKVQYVTEEELDKYRYYHPYWAKRKITDERIIELFDLGYDTETDCITMPNRDLNGNCVFVARRSVKTKYFNYPKNSSKPVYGLYEIKRICSPQDDIDVYLGDKLIQEFRTNHMTAIPNEIIICESMIDALTCFEYGKIACALNGLGSAEQFKILNAFPCRKYILATDMDSAGLRARDVLRNALKSKMITEYKWDINVAKDINDMSKEYFDSLVEYF